MLWKKSYKISLPLVIIAVLCIFYTSAISNRTYAQESASPKQMLIQLADALDKNDIDAALSFLGDTPKNRERLKSFTPEMWTAMAGSLRTATLVKSEGRTRIFSVRITRADGKFAETTIGLVQVPSGEWKVMFW